MNLSNLLNPELILCDLQGKDRRAVYLEMLRQLQIFTPYDLPPEDLYEESIFHEGLIDMPYEQGFAIPHARSAFLKDFYVIIGIHREGVQLQEQVRRDDRDWRRD